MRRRVFRVRTASLARNSRPELRQPVCVEIRAQGVEERLDMRGPQVLQPSVGPSAVDQGAGCVRHAHRMNRGVTVAQRPTRGCRGAPGPPSRRRRPGRRRVERRPRADAGRTHHDAGCRRLRPARPRSPAARATGARSVEQVVEVVGDQALAALVVEDDHRVEAVACGPPLVLLHVPRRHRRQGLPGIQPVIEVDDQAVHQRDQRGQLVGVGDAVADPVLERAKTRRRAGCPSGSR